MDVRFVGNANTFRRRDDAKDVARCVYSEILRLGVVW